MAVTEPTAGLAEINGARLYYEVIGAGHPLVLVHAGIADSRMWDEQLTDFGRHYRVIRYDMRGFGQSSLAVGKFAHRDDLFRLLEFLDVSSAFVLGISMGGQVAIELTLEHPRMVDALIRVNSGVGERPPSAAVRHAWAQVEEALDAGDIERAVEIELRLWVDGPHRTPDQVHPQVRERVRNMNTPLLAREAAYQGVPDELDPPPIARLGEIGVPTLVVIGDRDVNDVQTMANVLVEGIGDARKVVIAGAAHMVNMEQPETFNRVVLAFLDNVKPATRT